MPSKAQRIQDLAEQTALRLSGYNTWTAFLQCAAWQYKYPFEDQALIFAQRPDATACASIEVWNNRLHRWVNKGAKGIALLHEDGGGYRLDYVFDVSDTNIRYGDRLRLWQYDRRYDIAIVESLENSYGDLMSEATVTDAVISAAHNAVNDSKTDYLYELKQSLDATPLEDLDEFQLDVEFQETVEASVAYMILTRMGIDANEVFNDGEFYHIADFSTPAAMGVLGSAVSSIAGEALRNISRTISVEIKKFARNSERIYNEAERSDRHDAGIYTERRLSDTQPDSPGGGGEPGQVRSTSEDVPQEPQARPVLGEDADRYSAGASGGGGQGSNAAGGERSTEDGGGRRGRRSDEGSQSHEVDKADEQLPSLGGGRSSEQSGVQLRLFPSFEEQQNTVIEAERETRSAFSVPQQIIDEALCYGGNGENSVLRICAEFGKGRSSEENADFLKNEYGTGGRGFVHDGERISVWWNDDGIRIANGDTAMFSDVTISWEDTARRVGELLDMGRYAPAEVLSEVRGYELNEAANGFWYMRHDVNFDDYPELRELFKEEWFKGGFPDSTERLKNMLETTSGLGELMAATVNLNEAYSENSDVMRFRLYSPDKILKIFDDLQIERKTYTSEISAPELERFVTDDEINSFLAGRGREKIRTYLYFTEHPTIKDRANFLKREYGTSGGFNGTYDYNYSAKGMTISRDDIMSPFATVKLNWNDAAKRIGSLIDSGRYMTEKELNEDVPAYQREQTERRLYSERVDYLNRSLNLPEAERRQALPKRLFYFVNVIDNYERRFFTDYGLEEVLEATELEMDEILRDPEKSRRLADCLNKIGGAATDVTARTNGYALGDEVGALKYITLRKVGDFYEFFGEDARAAASVLGINLTHRTIDGETVDMCGVPAFALDRYAAILEENGYIPKIENESPRDIAGRMTDDDKRGLIDAVETALDFSEPETVSAEDMEVYKVLVSERDAAEAELDRAKSLINEYCAREFDSEADFTDLSKVSLAYTSVENGEHTIQVDADLTAISIKKYIDDQLIEERKYTSLAELSENELDGMTFDELVSVTEEQLNPFREKAAQTEESDITGRELTIDGRTFVVESVSNTGSVSLQDKTFQQGTGFPISRIDSIEFVRSILNEQSKEPELTPSFEASRPKRDNKNILYPEIPMSERSNFRITDDELGYGGQKEKFRMNMEAIRVLKQCENERRLATPEEQEVLSRYVGWGGLSEAFSQDKDNWSKEYAELAAALTPDEYEQARASTLNAHYTSPTVIKAMYRALENMGFKQGNILEPSCGIGNFMGLLPESMSESKIYGIELDSLTGRIARQLYQKNSIAIQGFEESSLPDSFFDAAIGNVPFGNYKVAEKRYDKNNFLIHDFFFAKSLDKVRPGGIIAFVTTKGTLDKQNPAVRRYIAQRADLLGAVRLPNDAFQKNANTRVTADIIFLQKRDRMIDIEPSWVHLAKLDNGITVNQYFADNPHMMLGIMTEENTQYGKDTTCAPIEGADLAAQLDEAMKNIHGQITEYEFEDISDEEQSVEADPNVRNFSYTLVNGDIYYRENSRMNKISLPLTTQNRVKGMIELRDCVRELIDAQTYDASDGEIAAVQERLNTLYDRFSAKYGLINSHANGSAFSSDSSYFLLCSLEIIGENGELVRKADMFTKRTIGAHREVTRVDTASEALALSIGEKARVDMEYMTSLTGKSEDELCSDLKGVIFLNPQYVKGISQKYLPADEYLSGNVREKLRTAKEAAEADGSFNINVEALSAVQPKDLTAGEITVRLGSTWVPPEYIERFTFELLGTPFWIRNRMKVHYSELTGQWSISDKTMDRTNIKAVSTFGTERINAYRIIEETLNLKDVRIFDYKEDADGKRTPVLNVKDTALAQQKQGEIKEAFADWIWKEPTRREALCKLYNEKFNSVRPREYDGSHISFVGMNPEIQLRTHQKNAVARILYGGNTLLGHVVGAGKTWTMAAAAMESRRLGLCSKPLFVVPNHLTEQWASEFLQLYPAANILVATKKDFETKNRKKFCGRIATGDYDAVIIGHSQFEKIPMSVERQRAILEMQKEEILDGIAEAKAAKAENFTVKQLEKTRRGIEAKLKKLNDQSRKDDVVTFEELGVDRIFVDEAHYYKNLFMYTKMRNVGGISQTEAQKSSDLFMKCRYLDELTGGKGNIFATGTPYASPYQH